ncbi:MAG: glycosyltransferase family 4 protein [Candidatus Aminicenantes bacterium]
MNTSAPVAAFFTSAALAFIFSFILVKIAYKYNIFTDLDENNFKQKKTPTGGGIALVVSLVISLLITRLMFGYIFSGVDEHISYTLLLVAFALIFALGVYDDLKGADAFKKFFFQIMAAILIYLAGFKIAEISIPFLGTKSIGIHILPLVLTILWVVGITNAVNIMDGLDGLALGISFFASLSLGILALLSAQYHIVLIIAVLLGAMIGFYPFNFPRAKIYLGDSGSLFIGFMLAVLSMAKIHRKVSLAIALMIPIIILLLPILETLVTITRRIYRRKSIFIRDTDHFHYRFLKKGFTETKTTLFLIFISFLFSLAGILFEFVQTKLRLLLFVLILLICFFLLGYLGYHNIFPKQKRQTPGE